MSGQIRNIREIPGDSLAKFTNEISRRLSRFLTKGQIDQLEDREDIYIDGQDFDRVVKLHTDLNAQTQFLFNKQYFPPTEPDNNKLRLWVRGTNLGNEIRDYSELDKDIDLLGDAILVDGAPHDDGIKTNGIKSIALRMNRPTSETENQEFINVAHAPSLSVNGITTGISYFIRFRVFSIAEQAVWKRTLFQKTDDDDPPADAVKLEISDTGRLQFTLRRAGTDYKYETAASTITTNTVYDVWCTYANAANEVHIYVNNVDKSLSVLGGTPIWRSEATDHNLSIFHRGQGDGNGFVYGDLYDFRLYREKVISATEVSRLNTNKWTIADIPFGQVLITNYWATYAESGSIDSFTSASFTATSFTT